MQFHVPLELSGLSDAKKITTQCDATTLFISNSGTLSQNHNDVTSFKYVCDTLTTRYVFSVTCHQDVIYHHLQKIIMIN